MFVAKECSTVEAPAVESTGVDPAELCPVAKMFLKDGCPFVPEFCPIAEIYVAKECSTVEAPAVDPKDLCPIAKIFVAKECSTSSALVDPKALCPLAKVFVSKECA